MNKFMHAISYYVAMYLVLICPYGEGLWLRQLQMGTLSGLNTFFLFFYFFLIGIILLSSTGLERDIILHFRPQLDVVRFKNDKVFWMKIWLLNTVILQILIGFLNEKAFPGARTLPLDGELVYWIASVVVVLFAGFLFGMAKRYTLVVVDALIAMDAAKKKEGATS
jgi:hypothetical protein